MIRLGVIGTGIISRAHLDAVKKLEGFKLIAVAEICEEKAKEISADYGVSYYIDYKEMCEKEDIDAVIINLPHFLHCEASVFSLERGIHVLCEKPMANTYEECQKMIAASSASGAKLAIGHVQRFVEANRIIKEYVESEKLGKLTMISEIRNANFFSEIRPKWFLEKKLSGGGMVMNFGAHALDKILSIAGGEITDINATCANFANDHDIEGHALIYLKVGDIPCSIAFNGYNTFSSNTTTFIFMNGALRITGTWLLEICDEPGGTFREYFLNPDATDPFSNQLMEFEKYIRGEENIMPNGEHGAKIIKAIEEIYENAGAN